MHAYSFLPSFLHSFIHACMHSFMHSFSHSVIQSFSHSVIRSFVRSFIHDLFGFKFFVFLFIWTFAALQARNGMIEHVSKFIGDILHSTRPFDLILDHFDWHSESVHYTCKNLCQLWSPQSPPCSVQAADPHILGQTTCQLLKFSCSRACVNMQLEADPV